MMKKSSLGFFRIVFAILKIAFVAGPIYIVVNNLMAVINGVSQGVITMVTQIFFDIVINNLNVEEGVKQIILWALILISTIIFSQIINGLNNFMGKSYFKKVVGVMRCKIIEKSATLEPIAFEDPLILDQINKATMGANNSLGLLFTVTTIFSYYLPYFVFMFIYLFKMDSMLSISIILIFIPVVLTQIVRTKLYANLEDRLAPLRRQHEYYTECIGEKETRSLGGFLFFNNLRKKAFREMNKEEWTVEKKINILELLMKTVVLAGFLGILLLFTNSLLTGRISIGMFAAGYSSINIMFNTMNAVICDHIANMNSNIGTIKNFLEFLEIKGVNHGAKKEKVEAEFVFKNVNFQYPKADHLALRDINIVIKEKERVALVGENGSGKTTFSKLLLGLYKPTDGKLYISGYDSAKTRSSKLFKDMSVVFQNYQKYKMTLRDNVLIGSNLEKKNSLEKIMDEVGFSLDSKSLDNGLESMLSREFNGVDLSGGEWQKVAIARGLYREHEIIVLDEPTSAIDPFEEDRLYKCFLDASLGKTAIFITHRLGLAQLSERIIVLDKGVIIEDGSHEQLMENKGKYYNLFCAQAGWYKREQ